MKPFALLLAVFLGMGVQAQFLTPRVLSSSGSYTVAGGYSLSQTTAEMTMIKTYASGKALLTQGFQQPSQKTVTDITEFSAVNGVLDLFPNPANGYTHLRYEFPRAGSLQIVILNTLGQQVSQRFSEDYDAGEKRFTLRTDGLATGIYYVNALFTTQTNQQYSFTKRLEIIR